MNGGVPVVGEDDLKAKVFLETVDSDRPLSPSEIGENLGERRQSVMYHLDTLVDQGIVVADDGEYFCQPLFVDPDFQQEISDHLGDLASESTDLIYPGEDPDDNQAAAVVENCLTAAISLHLFRNDESN